MTPTNVQVLVQDLAQTLLNQYDATEAAAISRIAAEEIFGKQALRIPTDISDEQQQHWQEVRSQLISGVPLQYALGRAWFMDLTLKVTPDVLIPRPETEELVEKIIQQTQISKPRILDIGTGSGCIALALKKAMPDAQVSACDTSIAALQIAAENAQQHNLDVTFFQSDILQPDALQHLPTFDLIVSNPPYIHPDEKMDMEQHVLAHEPHLALFTPTEDMFIFYHAIADACISVLRGWLWFEIHAQGGDQVAEILRSRGFQEVTIHRDMQQKNRFVAGRMQA